MIHNITQETDKMSHSSVRRFEINNDNYRPKTEPWERGIWQTRKLSCSRVSGILGKSFVFQGPCLYKQFDFKILCQHHSGS